MDIATGDRQTGRGRETTQGFHIHASFKGGSGRVGNIEIGGVELSGDNYRSREGGGTGAGMIDRIYRERSLDILIAGDVQIPSQNGETDDSKGGIRGRRADGESAGGVEGGGGGSGGDIQIPFDVRETSDIQFGSRGVGADTDISGNTGNHEERGRSSGIADDEDRGVGTGAIEIGVVGFNSNLSKRRGGAETQFSVTAR